MKLKFLTIISILSYYLLALSCSESPVPLSEVPQLMNVPEACVDLPLRHQALEQAKVEIEGAMSKLGVKAQPPELLFESRVLALVYKFDHWMESQEGTLQISSAVELEELIGQNVPPEAITAAAIDWSSQRVVASLEYPSQRIYQYGISDDVFHLFAARVDPCQDYDDFARIPFNYAHVVRFYRVPAAVTRAVIHPLEAWYRFNPVELGEQRCQRDGVVFSGGGHPVVLRGG